MADDFQFDIFLSYSSRDKAVVRVVAERLKKDGLRVWFDDWVLKPGDSIPAKIDEGLMHSRVLVFFISASSSGSHWAQLEANTFRFRDPLNKERRFIPLRVDDAPITGSLTQFLYINWLSESRDHEYPRLLEAVRSPPMPMVAETKGVNKLIAEQSIPLGHNVRLMNSYAFSSDGKRVLIGADEAKIRLWDVDSGDCLRTLYGHVGPVWKVMWSSDQCHALSGGAPKDNTIRFWDVDSGCCLRVFEGHTDGVTSVAWSGDERFVLSGSCDGTICLWEVATGRCLKVFQSHNGSVYCVTWGVEQHLALSSDDDNVVRLWNLKAQRCMRVYRGHTRGVGCVAWSVDGQFALSGSFDTTVRLWNVESGQCLYVFEGHTDIVTCLAWNTKQRFALSGSIDGTVRLWDLESRRCLSEFGGNHDPIRSVAWSADQRRALSGGLYGEIRIWDLSEFVT